MRALSSTGFDFFIGRKLFTLFPPGGAGGLQVHLSPLYVAAGADARLVADYTQRFEVLAPIASRPSGTSSATAASPTPTCPCWPTPTRSSTRWSLTVVGQRPQ